MRKKEHEQWINMTFIRRTRFWAPVFSLCADRYVLFGNKKIGISTSNYFLAQCVYNELTFQIIIILEWDIPIQRPIHTLS